MLIGLSSTAQLVVVGMRGRGGFSGLLLGSTGQQLLHHADCPVIIARGEDPSSRTPTRFRRTADQTVRRTRLARAAYAGPSDGFR